ncbi:hypothetical protein [uncultured Ilyobacter sp.]|uniref:hypothetical protein n=1 Tax=uncultured Ilyobacter sp. TaxID=544433 RepID=UPI0029C86EDB|nr:hypothetical protein [uncultured Ilyobacter sp.]
MIVLKKVEFYKNIADNISAEIARAGMSEAAFARKIGTTPKALYVFLNNMKNGKKGGQLSKIYDIGVGLGKDPAIFFENHVN